MVHGDVPGGVGGGKDGGVAQARINGVDNHGPVRGEGKARCEGAGEEDVQDCQCEGEFAGYRRRAMDTQKRSRLDCGYRPLILLRKRSGRVSKIHHGNQAGLFVRVGGVLLA